MESQNVRLILIIYFNSLEGFGVMTVADIGLSVVLYVIIEDLNILFVS